MFCIIIFSKCDQWKILISKNFKVERAAASTCLRPRISAYVDYGKLIVIVGLNVQVSALNPTDRDSRLPFTTPVAVIK